MFRSHGRFTPQAAFGAGRGVSSESLVNSPRTRTVCIVDSEGISGVGGEGVRDLGSHADQGGPRSPRVCCSGGLFPAERRGLKTSQ